MGKYSLCAPQLISFPHVAREAYVEEAPRLIVGTIGAPKGAWLRAPIIERMGGLDHVLGHV